MKHAKGEFDVKIVPQPLGGPVEDASLGRLTIEKELRGELVGSGRGQMLSAGMDATSAGSGAYVAIERITATLEGKKGSFVLVHRGLMTRGVPELVVTIVPDSGTGELTGIAGTFHIVIAGKQHFYDLEYTLPPRP